MIPNTPKQCARFAKELKIALVYALCVIEVHVGNSPVCESHDHGSSIFSIDFKAAHVSRKAANILNWSQEPHHVIEFMRIKQYPSAQSRPGRICLAIILPWAPIGQIGAKLASRRRDLANNLFLENFLHPSKAWMKFPVRSNETNEALRLYNMN